MTEFEIEAIKLGKPNEVNPGAIHVTPLPKGVHAMIHTRIPGLWYFNAQCNGKCPEDTDEEDDYETSELALEALKQWLIGNCG